MFESKNKDKIPKKKECALDNHLTLVKKYIDPVFGEVDLLTDQNKSEEIICKKILIDDETEFKTTLKLLNHRSQIKHKNLLGIIDYGYYTINDWCSTSYVINAYYPYNDHSFNKELEIRKSCNRPF